MELQYLNMPKREKSKKLYGILILDSKESRDKNLSNILETEYKPEPTSESFYIAGDLDSVKLSNVFSYIKTWRTISGVERYRSKLLNIFQKNPNEKISSVFGKKNDDIFFSEIEIEIVDITSSWNDDVDRRIQKEIELCNLRIKRLNSLKII